MAFKEKQKERAVSSAEKKTLIFAPADGWIPARHPCEGREGMTAVGAGER